MGFLLYTILATCCKLEASVCVVYERVQPVTTSGVFLVEKTSQSKYINITNPKFAPKNMSAVNF